MYISVDLQLHRLRLHLGDIKQPMVEVPMMLFSLSSILLAFANGRATMVVLMTTEEPIVMWIKTIMYILQEGLCLRLVLLLVVHIKLPMVEISMPLSSSLILAELDNGQPIMVEAMLKNTSPALRIQDRTYIWQELLSPIIIFFQLVDFKTCLVDFPMHFL